MSWIQSLKDHGGRTRTPERCESLSHSFNTALNFSSDWCSRWSFAPSGGCEHIQAEPPSVWLLCHSHWRSGCYMVSMASTPLWTVLLFTVWCQVSVCGSDPVTWTGDRGPGAGGADGSWFVLQRFVGNRTEQNSWWRLYFLLEVFWYVMFTYAKTRDWTRTLSLSSCRRRELYQESYSSALLRRLHSENFNIERCKDATRTVILIAAKASQELWFRLHWTSFHHDLMFSSVVEAHRVFHSSFRLVKTNCRYLCWFRFLHIFK